MHKSRCLRLGFLAVRNSEEQTRCNRPRTPGFGVKGLARAYLGDVCPGLHSSKWGHWYEVAKVLTCSMKIALPICPVHTIDAWEAKLMGIFSCNAFPLLFKDCISRGDELFKQ